MLAGLAHLIEWPFIVRAEMGEHCPDRPACYARKLLGPSVSVDWHRERQRGLQYLKHDSGKDGSAFGSTPSYCRRRYIGYSRYMENQTAIAVLGALAQGTRLDVFRLLVRREPDGMAAGEIARLLDVPQNTMSAHLGILARAGIVRSERHSRSIIYRADLNGLRALTLFLVKDCCAGSPELCAPLLAELTPCC